MSGVALAPARSRRAHAPRGTCALRPRSRLPIGPLQALVDSSGGYAPCAQGLTGLARDRVERAYWRAVSDGQMTWWSADLLAIELLGLHPLLVWGDDWLN